MRTLIFDIETVGEAWDSLDDITKRSITRKGDTPDSEPESYTGSFSPLLGQIVTLSLYDVERAQGAVYYVGDNDIDTTLGTYVLKQRSEQSLLSEFWEGATEYDAFVSWNGRRFDVPFLLHRSIAYGIHPTRELMKYRYLAQQSAPFHIDLKDELTFYGALSSYTNLHLFCRAYGIPSPQETGVSGSQIAELYREKKFRELANYSTANVAALTALYELWLQNLAPASFRNLSDLYF